MSISKIGLCLVLLLSLFSQSCTTMMDPDAAVLKSSIKQLKPRAKLRPASPNDMKIYVRYRNSSGEDLDIRDKVFDEIKKSNYTITQNIDEANYVLIADLRYVGLKAKEGYGHAIFGALLGAVAGAVLGDKIGAGGTNEQIVGGGLGALLGGAAGKAIDNRNKIITVDMVVDLSIGERIKGGINTKRSSSTNQATSQAARSKTQEGSNESGSSSTKYSESTEFEQKEDFFYHENRFIATAKKLGLTYEEASSSLSGKMSRAIANSLP